MKIITKEEAKQQCGEHGTFSRKVLAGQLGYLSGVDSFDELKLNKHPKDGALFVIHFLPKAVLIETATGLLNYQRVALPYDRLKYLVIEPQQQVFEQKNKSVVGRALVGGLLLGPVGAIVGGMTGIGDKTVQKSDLPDNIATLGYIDDDGSEKLMLLTLKNSKKAEVERSLNKWMPELLKSAEAIPDVPQAASAPAKSGLADEILKLKSLLDDGILTQAEFDEAKKKLLA